MHLIWPSGKAKYFFISGLTQFPIIGTDLPGGLFNRTSACERADGVRARNQYEANVTVEMTRSDHLAVPTPSPTLKVTNFQTLRRADENCCMTSECTNEPFRSFDRDPAV